MVGKNFTMRIDGGVSQTIVNEGDRERLEVSDPLYFGGVPPDLKDSAYRKWHIRHTESFGGTIIKYLAISLCLSSNDNKAFKMLDLQKAIVFETPIEVLLILCFVVTSVTDHPLLKSKNLSILPHIIPPF